MPQMGGGEPFHVIHEFELAGRWPDGVWLIPQASMTGRVRATGRPAVAP